MFTDAYKALLEEVKIFGPYKGSDANDGRPLYVKKWKGKDGKWKTTSTNKARLDYEKKNGVDLPKDVHVDHKDNDQKNDNQENLRAMDGGKNVGKENKRRAQK